MTDIPAWLSEFFDSEDALLLEILKPLIEAAAKSGAQFSADQLGLADWKLINEAAMHWAEGHAGELVSNVKDSTRQAIAEKVADYIGTPGATLKDLMERIKSTGIDSQARANLIAQTEITTSYAEGNQIAFKENGVAQHRWNTNGAGCEDICRKLNGQITKIGEPFKLPNGEVAIGVWGKPIYKPGDSHPGCMCWLTPVVEGHEDRG